MRPVIAPADATMRVCGRCGIIAPRARNDCLSCGTPFGARDVPPRADGAYWVAVKCHLQCRICGQQSPLNEVDTDGQVRCLLCGTAQAFDVTSWSEALDFAHGVGDLGWPQPEGRHPREDAPIASANPYATVGTAGTWLTKRPSGESRVGAVVLPRNLTVIASPGHPLCRECSTPLEAQGTSTPGELSTSCPGCGAKGVHRVSDEARRICWSLLGVVADEHRVDRPVVQVQESGGGSAVALRCPSCSAPLPVSEGARLATCEYCKTTSRVPLRTAYRTVAGAAPEPDTLWALFYGPSAKRAAVEKEAHPDVASSTEIGRIVEQPPTTAARPAPWALAIAIPALFLVGLTVALGARTESSREPLVCESNDERHVAALELVLPGQTAVVARSNCHITLSGCSISGQVAIQASGNARVRIEGGRIHGDQVAIVATENAVVEHIGGVLEGGTSHDQNAQIIEVPALPQ